MGRFPLAPGGELRGNESQRRAGLRAGERHAQELRSDAARRVVEPRHGFLVQCALASEHGRGSVDAPLMLEVPAPHGAVRASAKALASTLLLSSGVCCDRRPRAALALLSTDESTS